MRFSTPILLSTALFCTSVYAGLEDAKYSVRPSCPNPGHPTCSQFEVGLNLLRFQTKLTPELFDRVIASQSQGTLVAFFATWCGHCKSLEPVWTKVAQAFDGDDRVRTLVSFSYNLTDITTNSASWPT